MPPIRRPSRHRSTSGHSYDDDFIERMAQRTAFYITTFDEHSKVVRGKRKEQVGEAYNRVIEQGLVLPANTPRTSLSMQCKTWSLWNRSFVRFLKTPLMSMFLLISSDKSISLIHTSYVLIGLTAHSLLLSQLGVMGKPPHDVTARIDTRVFELR